jgi:hypothetical protein
MLDKLFSNAGEKIKNYAKTLFMIEAIASIIAGIALIAEDEDMFLVGILAAVAGIVVAHVSCLFLVAFGDLVQSSVTNKEINEKILNKLNETSAE